MNAPKRWIETASGSSELERELLRPALDIDIPAGTEERIWTELAALMPISAVAAGSTLAAAGSSSATTLKASGSAVVATSIGKLGVAMAVKAFAIGATSGALVAGGYAALDVSHESVPAERVKERVATEAPPTTAAAATTRAPVATATLSPSLSSAVRDEDSSAPLQAPNSARPSPHRASNDALADPQVAAPSKTGSFGALPPLNAQPGSSSGSSSRVSRLGDEARALKRARDALQAGDLATAFAALEAARTEFKDGTLGEEREALTIQLLARSGQRAAARVRAESFLRSFPNSPHAPRVREVAGSLPP